MSSTPVAHLPIFGTEPTGAGRPAEAEPVPQPLSLVGFECSLDTISLDALEAVVRSIPRTELPRWFDRWTGIEEVALLTTCHRVEIFLLIRKTEDRERWQRTLPGTPGIWRIREGREVVRHLFRVAAGRESLAVGELEVGHQVRAAGNQVLSRHPRPVLRELLDRAATAAEELAAQDPPAHSIASIAVSRLQHLLDRPYPRVLVVGAGTVGRQVARCLSPNSRTTLVFHERPPSESFLRAVGADAVRMDRLFEAAAGADGIVTAAKFGNHGLRAHDLPRDHPLVLVDLGMPRNIDPAVRELPNIRLVDLEELHALSKPRTDAVRPDPRIDQLADRFSERLERLLWEPYIDALYRAAEATRRSEVKNALRFLGALDPGQEVAIERLTRRLVSRLLTPTTERIRSLPVGPAGDLQRRLAVELLRPAPADP